MPWLCEFQAQLNHTMHYTNRSCRGGFTEELGEDFLGLRELGLEKEFGLTSLSVPRKLLRGRRDNAANAKYVLPFLAPYFLSHLK